MMSLQTSCREEPLSLVINSVDRSNGTFGSGSIPLGSPIKGCKKITLLSSMIPNTAYILNGVTFTWTESVGPVTLNFNITGNYTSNSLALFLQTQMTAASLAAGNVWTYTVVYVASSGTMTYSEDSGLNTFRIDANAAGFPVYRLGFGTTSVGAATGFATYHNTPFIVDLSAPKYAIISLIGPVQSGQAITSGANPTSGHFVVPLGTNSFETAQYYQKSMYDNTINVVKGDIFSNFNYTFLDVETKSPMLLQSNWSLHLRVE